MLYFFAAEGNFETPNSGIKVARADLHSYTDKSKVHSQVYFFLVPLLQVYLLDLGIPAADDESRI